MRKPSRGYLGGPAPRRSQFVPQELNAPALPIAERRRRCYLCSQHLMRRGGRLKLNYRNSGRSRPLQRKSPAASDCSLREGHSAGR